ncbi:MAG: regulatory protein RecX [Elusimicrobia bacterium]|nr:regulatory protein RecX [Elusimicrobiota bacterium]
MIVTSILPDKRGGKYGLYVDGRLTLKISGDVLKCVKIAAGQGIDGRELDSLISLQQIHDAVGYSKQLISRRKRSRKEIRDKLEAREYEEDIIEKTLLKLEESGYLDDTAFAGWWISERRKGKPKADRAIVHELKSRGVSEEEISEAFGGLPASEKPEELETARRACIPVIEKYRKSPYITGRRRLTAFLRRRGFSWETVNSIIEEFLGTGR